MEGWTITISEDYIRDEVNGSFHYKTYYQVLAVYEYVPEEMGLNTPNVVNSMYQLMHHSLVVWNDGWFEKETT